MFFFYFYVYKTKSKLLKIINNDFQHLKFPKKNFISLASSFSVHFHKLKYVYSLVNYRTHLEYQQFNDSRKILYVLKFKSLVPVSKFIKNIQRRSLRRYTYKEKS